MKNSLVADIGARFDIGMFLVVEERSAPQLEEEGRLVAFPLVGEEMLVAADLVVEGRLAVGLLGVEGRLVVYLLEVEGRLEVGLEVVERLVVRVVVEERLGVDELEIEEGRLAAHDLELEERLAEGTEQAERHWVVSFEEGMPLLLSDGFEGHFPLSSVRAHILLADFHRLMEEVHHQ